MVDTGMVNVVKHFSFVAKFALLFDPKWCCNFEGNESILSVYVELSQR